MNLAELARQTAREIAEGKAAIFLGVGASLGTESERANGEGIPGSSELTRAIADHFGVNLQYDESGDVRSTLRGIASRAVRVRDASTVKRFVIEKIRPGCGKPLRVHRALARIAPTIVMTTNYDDLYEAAIQELGKECAKVVQSPDLVGLPLNQPRVLKLHGDIERSNEIVLTGPDYQAWRKKLAGLQAEVVAALQKHTCVFVGYSVRDENLGNVLSIITENLDSDAAKHFAVVHEVDEERDAELDGSVEFVEGDATTFCELLADEYEALAPQPRDPQRERATFEAQLEAGDLEEAGRTCKALADYLIAHGENTGAASLWRSFGAAAAAAGEHNAAAAAFREAGILLWEAGAALDAEPNFSSALREAQVAGEPVIEREAHSLLQQVRLTSGHYYDVLRDTEEELRAYGEAVSPSVTYSLRAVRADAQEILYGIDEALGELRSALSELPETALYFRTKARAAVARLLADKYEWEEAFDALNAADSEVTRSAGADGVERRRCEAILTLVRGNVHQALGEDDMALRSYERCASVLEELGEADLAVSALQGFVDSATYLLHEPPDETLSRLSDLASDSREHQRITDLERRAVTYLAEGDLTGGNLAAARDLFARAAATANAVHSQRSIRRVRIWQSDVLLKAGFPHEALIAYAVAGETQKAIEVTKAARKELPAGEGDPASRFSDLIEVALKGALSSRGAALAALKELWDVLPEDAVLELTAYLSGLDGLAGSMWADRNVLSNAADLVYALAPRLDEEQSRHVGMALVETIRRNDLDRSSFKSACLALARLATTHPATLEELDVPTARLAEIAGRDVLNDLYKAMSALMNLALAGHEEARREVQNLLEDADTLTRVNWRHVLHDIQEEELASAIRQLLPQSINRVQPHAGGTSVAFGAFSPMFLRDWILPESVKSEVAQVLSEAVIDSTALLPDRQAAALVLGLKAEQFGEDDRQRAVEALMAVLTERFEADDAVRSIDNPLSMLRMNIGQAEDVIAAALESLLAFSNHIEDSGQRRRLLEEVGKRNASQVEPIGRSVAYGLRHFVPRDTDEEQWFQTRLLLLLHSYHPSVRQSATHSLAIAVERETLAFDAELLATVLFLAKGQIVEDRVAAAHALARMERSTYWGHPELSGALGTLRSDPSYLVRRRADGAP